MNTNILCRIEVILYIRSHSIRSSRTTIAVVAVLVPVPIVLSMTSSSQRSISSSGCSSSSSGDADNTSSIISIDSSIYNTCCYCLYIRRDSSNIHSNTSDRNIIITIIITRIMVPVIVVILL